MATYNVYGVGNALVDKEFEVDDAFFTEHGIEKGVMTLVDQQQQQHLVSILEEKYGVKKRASGGSAANTLYALSQFGGTAYFTFKVADDETGDYYLQQLGDHNIETNSANQHPDGVSGQCMVMISPDAERTMHTFLGISENVSEKELNYEAAKISDYIYLEGYLVTSPTAKAAIIRLKEFAEENGVKTAMTFSDPAMLQYFKDDINDVFGTGVDLLFCNEQEALLWTETDDIDSACAIIQTKAKQFAITRGDKGALLFDGSDYISIAANKVTAIDTNGAGDMFAGAFLYAITNGKSFEEAGKLASLGSATVVENYGPRLEAGLHAEISEKVFG